MSSAEIATVVKMLETLPEATQQQVVERVREYIADLRDEADWDAAFARTQPRLMAAARQAKQDIAAGRARPMTPDQL